MPGPFTCTNMLVQVNSQNVGVVTGMDISLSYEQGTVQHVYGTDVGYIPLGGKRATFRLQRWFKTDSDTDLLFDLFDQKLAFTLSGELDGVSGSSIVLSGCKGRQWRVITGDANTIVGEEIAGEAPSWNGTNIT